MGARIRCGLVVALLAAFVATVATESQDDSFTCPFEYERHSLTSVLAGTVRAWLFDGIFHNLDTTNSGGRFCVNCHRGSLWPAWCGRKKTGQPYWDLQQCEASIARLAIESAGEHDDIRGALTLTPCDLFGQLRGRTLWIVGDSMSKDLIKAFKCFMLEFWDLHQYHVTNNYTAMHYLQSLPGYGEPHCIHLPNATRMCQVHAIQGDLFVNTTRARAGVLPLLEESGLLLPHDVVVLNFGLWHGDIQRPQYVQHLHELGRWWAERRDKYPHVLFMETPKQHFADAADGDFPSKWLDEPARMAGNYTCGPAPGVEYLSDGTLAVAGGGGGGSGSGGDNDDNGGSSGDRRLLGDGKRSGGGKPSNAKGGGSGTSSSGSKKSKAQEEEEEEEGKAKKAKPAQEDTEDEEQEEDGGGDEDAVAVVDADAMSPGEIAASIARGTWRNADARRILSGAYGMRLVPIYNATVAFWRMHRANFKGQECSHYCHPSVPQLWLWILHRTLADAGVTALPAGKAPARERNGCARVFERDQTKLGLPKPVDKVYVEAEVRRRDKLRATHGALWRLVNLFGRRHRRRLQLL